MDFDLVWRDLASKVKNAYDLFIEILKQAPVTTSKTLKVEFHQRTATGIKPITDKTFSFLSTSFSQSELYIDPNNQEDRQIKVLSMIFWMVMEPNIVPVVKLPNGKNFLIMDINQLYDGNQFSSSLIGEFSPPSNFEQYQKLYSKIFSRSDLMNFVNFHNHELSDDHSDMVSYVMDKFVTFYRNLLDGSTKSRISDLR